MLEHFLILVQLGHCCGQLAGPHKAVLNSFAASGVLGHGILFFRLFDWFLKLHGVRAERGFRWLGARHWIV